jgi:hypothetical protein
MKLERMEYINRMVEKRSVDDGGLLGGGAECPEKIDKTAPLS